MAAVTDKTAVLTRSSVIAVSAPFTANTAPDTDTSPPPSMLISVNISHRILRIFLTESFTHGLLLF